MRPLQWNASEVTEAEWREWIKKHPRRPHLKQWKSDDFPGVLFIYDAEAFQRDTQLDKIPSYHAVAERRVWQGKTWFIVRPETAGPTGASSG